MRGAAGLAVLTAGAILTFAVSAQVPGINLRITGVIIMVAGVVALITPARAAQWARRPPWSRGRPGATDDAEADDLAYLLQDPAVLAAEVLRGAAAGRPGWGSASERLTPGGTQHDGHNDRAGPA
jgi:hypothetical protein